MGTPDRRFTTRELEAIARYLRLRVEDICKVRADNPHVQALLLELNCLDAQRAQVLGDIAIAPDTPDRGLPAHGHNSNTGHGHVWKRPDGVKARCGGPGMCIACARDLAQYGYGPRE